MLATDRDRGTHRSGRTCGRDLAAKYYRGKVFGKLEVIDIIDIPRDLHDWILAY